MTREEFLKAAKPIPFNTDEVRAILDGRKTATRQVMKPANPFRNKEGYCQGHGLWVDGYNKNDEPNGHIKDYSVSSCWWRKKSYMEKYARYHPGDILYVMERFCNGKVVCGEDTDGTDAPYVSQEKVDTDFIPYEWCVRNNIRIENVVWKPSIHMPKKNARIFLRVTNVRLERLHEITPEQIMAESITGLDLEHLELMEGHYDIPFAFVWDATLPKASFEKYRWSKNPWVYAIEFERVLANE